MALYTRLDGTGRDLREVQVHIRDSLQRAWKQDKRHIVVEAVVASGKSLIARMVQLEHNGFIVTPQNILIEQYTKDYPTLNWWWGKHNFKCSDHPDNKVSCAYKMETLKLPACANCPLVKNRLKAMNGEHTIFNPLSLYYLRKRARKMGEELVMPEVIVVDEAHAVLRMIMQMSGKDFDVSEEAFPEELTKGYNLVPWLQKKADAALEMAQAYESTGEYDKQLKFEKEYERYLPVIDGVENDEAQYSLLYNHEKQKIEVRPLYAPQSVVKEIFGDARLILLSGTMFHPDIVELLGTDDYHLIKPPNPIPETQRPVIFAPTQYAVNKDCDLSDLACDIERIIDMFGRNERTIVHVPYSWSQGIADAMTRSVITHDKTNKKQALEQFKQTADGVLIASGMAEGIDLKGDLCRLNIIPKILWPNLADQHVEKRKAQPGGELWYDLEALKILLQQIGRSTRSPEDWSITVIMDSGFARLINRQKNVLPCGLFDSIVWSGLQSADRVKERIVR